ncbi:non-ribosomal peptide synthase/polyketide synthase [Pyxidicoccus sp. MSG2]|uniref:non-ribosomal peptide synthase/polyketide synthase n=1 Tax=Pyxidicoccus sp. MSG2 TaxID=2996790 RepID=UPI002270B535|nr:non-ribosomal peptide synthase/polyketide synthase [Pyxidicoccus sp. MSG2]MCY1015549.1 non-ribosomal peptide synthase/polyketide synthase [Pyxidicoccus sp. MSG2]
MSQTPRTAVLSQTERREALARLLQERGPGTKLGPVSFAQQQLWLVDRLSPGGFAYNLFRAFRLTGPLDAVALRKGLDALVQRHEVLRTTYADVGGQPVQVVAPAREGHWPTVDLSDVSEREDTARRLARDEAERPFDLEHEHPLRATLLRLGTQDHVLLLSLHHIACDEWSLGVLVRELGTLYRAFSSGVAPSLPALPIQYADFARWQRQKLTGEALEPLLAEWRRRLSGPLPSLELPADHPRPGTRTLRGGHQRVHLPAEVARELEALARREGVTPFMLLLAAWQVLLRVHSGQEDLLVGTPVAGRGRAEVEGLMGAFVNVLVLRTDLSGDPSFRELLARVRATCLDAYSREDVPFDRLVEALEVRGDAGRTPLFQTMFTFQAAPAAALELADVRVSRLEVERRLSKFDVSLHLAAGPEGLSGELEYSADLFTPDTAARLAERLEVLLRGVALAPDARLSALPVMAEAERHRLLVEWNATRTDYPRDATLPALFAAQAARTPDAVAVAFGDLRLTYRELDRRANGLAHHLRALGVRTGTPVGLCVERSLELVVGVLGILKAGGAYVPLDPSHPRERLALLLDDTGVPWVLASPELLPRLPETLGLQVVPLGAVTTEREDAPRTGVTAGDLAYVVYTSGSTGRPKGVGVPHRAVVRLVMGADYARFGPDEVFLQLAPLAFDASTFELWGSLLHGARLVMFPPHTPSLEELGQALRRERVTTLWLTAGLFEQMVSLQPEALEGVRQLLAGGDVLPPGAARERLARGVGVLVNGYGPTEGTTFTCCHVMRTPEDVGPTVPIGRPIANTRVYVLDATLRPVPLGVPGELYAGGDGVALGYLGRPELTAEHFVPDAFSTEPGARLYRTGDRVRWRANGTLEFLGRLDGQLKVRGYRIEPGEVEAALRLCSDVRDAVVVAREDGASGRRLVAYVVPTTPGATLASTVLRDFLKQRLPEPMVPSAFVPLEALPLTANGKVDRRALPVPDSTVAEPRPDSAPRTATEELLADLWARLFGLERVGVEEDFFALGGHSLVATRLVAWVRDTFGVELPVRRVFEAPTVSSLATTLDTLRSEGQRLQAPPLEPVAHEGPTVLSSAQQRVWFATRFEPGSVHYNVPFLLRWKGALDVGVLERSLRALVARHESLRTTFTEERGRPVQRIAPEPSLALPVVDLSGLPPEAREDEARRYAAEEAARPFDLEQGPLLRSLLLRLGPDSHTLLLTLHHIVFDGESIAVLLRELRALYAALSSGTTATLPPLPIQYADFAVWQQRCAQGGTLEPQLAWWRERLAGLEPLELPADRPAPTVRTREGARLQRVLPRRLTDALAALGRREGVTRFMLLLAAFQVLLSRYTGQTDVAVGAPISGRTRREVEGLIGFFVNTLVLRGDLSGAPTFRALLGRVRNTCLGAYAHQDLPFDQLVEALHPERGAGHSPLFQVMFSVQDGATPVLELPGLCARLEDGDPGRAKMDLGLAISESEAGLVASFGYGTELFDRETVGRIADHYVRLLESIAASPDPRITELSMLAPEERHRLLVEWNATDTAGPVDSLVPALFEARAALTPDALAVEDDAGTLTYGAMERRANRLAHHLRSLGVRPEVRVGLCVKRSGPWVEAALGILKAGGAYVPLDPNQPMDRLASMLRDSGAPVVITTEAIADELPSDGEQWVLLDADAPLIESQPDTPLSSGARAEHLAYVIYTSGSTGQPKGVGVTHGSLANLVHWHLREYAVGPEDRVSHVIGTSFDASMLELWPTLVTGASLHIPSDETRTQSSRLLEWLAARRVTLAVLPAPLAEAVLSERWPANVALRVLVSGGDRLHSRPRADARFRLVNQYGPTESTVVATCATVAMEDTEAGLPPIGRPIANTRVYVLDRELQPVPVRATGELYVSGAGLARGYLGQPTLTAERFIPHPFSTEPGARLYRTGDRVRWRADGALEFLGRADEQVKVRGFRIEPGEVEAALLQHADVREAVVVAREDGPGGKRLVAYVVPHSTAPVATALREFLLHRLPEHMVPSAVVMLDALPLTPNGKVDRKALPVPGVSLTAASPELYVAPRTDLERRVAAIWSELLGVARVGVEDDFFELGGHSLLATQALSRLRESFGVEVPLQRLFEEPTVAAVARNLESSLRDTAPGARREPPLVPVPRNGPLPLSFAQQRLYFLEQLAPGGATYHVPLVVRLEGALEADLLREGLREVVRRHEALRTTFAMEDGHPIQVIAPELALDMPVVDLTGLSSEERDTEAERRAREEALRPFDLHQGPLVRATLLRLAPEVHALLLSMHHIVSDGWSQDVFQRELSAIYSALRSGGAATLPPLPVQSADFAVWQREWLNGEVRETQLAWWREQLAGPLPVLELPADHARPQVWSHRGGRLRALLPRTLSGRVEALAQREGVTHFMLLLAAFQVLLMRHTGQEDLLVGTPVAGRNRREVEGLIGFFVNTLVLRGDLSGAPTFRELLGRVRERCLGAYAHQDLPFEQLVEALHPERDLGRTPLVQAMFVLQGATRAALELPGVSVRLRDVETGTSKLDLTLSMRETENGWIAVWEFSTDLFEPATVARVAGRFERLLEAALADPDQRIDALPVMHEEERRKVLVEWNTTAADFPRDLTLPELFERIVALHPDSVAVESSGSRLSYTELEQRANRLAHHLRSLGVGPEVRVGLCVERSARWAVGALAILKAGGAYVALDPAYPPQRLEWLLNDSRAHLLVTTEALAARLSDSATPRVLLDADAPLIAAQPELAPHSDAGPAHLAYVIYTSGSTGQPKAVGVTHASLMNLVAWHQRTYALTPDSRSTQVAGTAFDASVWELWPPLASGASLHIPGDEERASPALLLQWLAAQAITHCFLPTPLAEAVLTEEVWPQGMALRVLLTGGDRLRQRPRAEAPFQLVNHYGPTESTVVTTCATVAVEGTEAGLPPIGRPIANTRVYVLDRELQPVPVGVTGELYVGGAGLARGYLNQPALTAERFIPHPFSVELGARLYRTGDRVRWRADSALEFLGRADEQVKVRGFRIEPGEVEAALLQHANVREAVVVAREDGPGGKRLVAYVVPHSTAPVATALRDFLLHHLPEHMVPAAFVTLEALPLTPNGKVDRKALPAPETHGTASASGYAAPSSPTEEKLASIWASVLRVRQVGVRDNFFALGGDSILSLQVISRAHQVGLKLTPRQLFQHPTVEQLARVVQLASTEATSQEHVSGPVPLTPIQHWFFEWGLPTPHHFNQAFLLELRQPLSPEVLEQALRVLCVHHDALRMRFTHQPPALAAGAKTSRMEAAPPHLAHWHQENAEKAPPLTLLQVDVSHLPLSQQPQAIASRAAVLQASLRLEDGGLVRAALFHRGPGLTPRLLLAIHHLVVDAVSWRFLLDDLQACCLALSQGRPPALPPKTTSFQAWARRLHSHAHSEALSLQASFWTGLPWHLVHPLPRDTHSGDNSLASARHLTVSLPPDETRLLLQDTPSSWRVHINDLLLAALAQSLCSWTGHSALAVNLEGHGREDLFDDVDLSRTTGWFTSLFPLVLSAEPKARPGEVLASTHQQLSDVPHKGLGFGLLRYLRELQDPATRALAALPSPEVSFNYLGQLDSMADTSALFGLSRDPTGPMYGDQGPRRHVLDVNGHVLDGRLVLRWTYSDNLHERSTIEHLAHGCLDTLRALIRDRDTEEAHRRRPTDFPLARLAPTTLDRVLQTVPGVADLYPVSPLQQGLLFHALLSPTTGTYVTQLTWEMHGLDPDAFRRAWEVLLQRHAILRTAFLWEGLPEPLQCVQARVDLPWRELDWSDVPRDARDERLRAFLAEDRGHGFKLTQAPLLRLTLIQMDAEIHRLVWSHHHLLLDGWSMGPLLDELFASYEAVSKGESPVLPDRPPYRDYIAWLRTRDAARAESFWRESLAGFTEPTPLPADSRPGRAQVETGVPEGHLTLLPAALTERLQAFARRHHLTMNTLAQGAWALLLGRYSGQRDVVFGTTVAGRPPELPGAESMIGLFINTLPVRVRLPERERLVPWLQALQAQQSQVRQHEATPLAQLQSWCEVPRGTPLFDSLFAFENYPMDGSVRERANRLAVRDLRSSEHTHYPLTAVILPRHGELLLKLEYESGRFGAEAMRQLVEHYQTLLEGMLTRADQPLASLPWMKENERARLLVEWNATHAPVPSGTCIHEKVEAHARRTPRALAVSDSEETLTYAELERRANRLAHHLRSLGVGPEVRVGLCVERSARWAVGALAILKAGGAYVALDPAYPPQRLEWLLNDSKAHLLVTTEALAGRLSDSATPRVLLDADAPLIAAQPELAPHSDAGPEHLAYVIYTSGSTGQPKAVGITHASLMNLVAWHQRTYALTPDSRSTQVAGTAFDASIWELWPPLASGASLHIPGDEERASPALLLQWLAAQGITHCFLPTPLAEAVLTEEVWPQGMALRVLLTGGDRLRQRPHTEARFQLVNHYGPTESTVVTTCATVAVEGTEAGLPPIGRPIANTQVYVLDRELQPVPVGVTGELYVGGAGLARGYLGQPALTAERFIPHPFRTEPGARLYRTEDRVRWRADGALDFLGRADAQVKVRGFRIEPGEIEAALLEHPDIREATVVAREDGPGGKRLVAYVVPHSSAPVEVADSVAARAVPHSTAPATTALRDFLLHHLPEHMVPAAFVTLEALPLTPNGKVDRKALPAPETHGTASASGYAAPSSLTEEKLAAIWASVLRVQQVGVRDNFFALGGDSILSLQVISRAHQAGLKLSPRQLFQHPTVEQLARVVQLASTEATSQEHVSGPVPLTPIQHWFFEWGLPTPHHFNQAFLLEVRQPLSPEVLEQALSMLCVHHDALRMRFTHPPHWHQENAEKAPPLTLLQVDVSHLPLSQQPQAIASRAAVLQASMRLEDGGLVRAALFHRGPGLTPRLLLAIHHLVVDAVSWRFLLDDLQAYCLALSQGRPPALPPKTTSFQAWARRLHSHANSEALSHQAPFWTGLPWHLVHPLPRDTHSADNSLASARHLTVSLSPDETRLLLQDTPSAWRVHINDLLLAALAQSLCSWTGHSALAVNLEGHGREDLFDDVDLSRTTGWFTTIHPVVLPALAHATPGDTVSAVHHALTSIPDKGLGFGLLRYLRQSTEDTVAMSLAALPSPEVSFNYLGQLDSLADASALFGLTWESPGPDHGAQGHRRHVLDVNGHVMDGRLVLRWTYSDNLHERSTIDRLAHGCLDTLRALIQTRPAQVPPELQIEDTYPLSPLQRRMLRHTRLAPGTGAYGTQLTWEFHQGLDVPAFRRAWEAMVRRHAILRTSFPPGDGTQQVHAQVDLPWKEHDWRTLPAESQHAHWDSVLRQDRVQGFDPAAAPLLRLTLARTGTDTFRFAWSFHHLLMDGWSVGLLMDELLATYQGQHTPLPSRPPYRDFITWMKRRTSSTSEAWWQDTLTRPTPLPGDRGPPGTPTVPWREHLYVLPESLTSALTAFARRHHLTLNTLALGAWARVLAHHTGVDTVLTQVIIAGRPPELPGAESIIGPLIDALPLRIPLTGGEPCLPWLQDLQARQLALAEYAHTEPPRSEPLPDTLYVFENYPRDAAVGTRAQHLGLRRIHSLEQPFTALDAVVLPGRELKLELSYAPERLDPAVIERLPRHWRAVLESLLANPEQRLADLPGAGQDEAPARIDT